MKVGIAYSLAPAPEDRPSDGPDDFFEEFDRPETIEAIADVIRAEGHEVVRLGDGRQFLARVLADPPDFVFNIAEGEGVGRCREARVPAALEMLGIPYSGSDPLTLAACLDKNATRQMGGAARYGLPVGAADPDLTDAPRFPMGRTLPPSLVRTLSDFAIREFRERVGPDRPIIIKPAFEGSSKGIRSRCVAQTQNEAVAAYEELSENYQQPILIEEFIDGEEVTVGLVGVTEGRSGENFIGIMRIKPKVSTTRFVYSLEVKRDWRNLVEYETPAALAEETERALLRTARIACKEFGIRDLARLDFRVRDGVPYFIEANPLPGLAPVTSDLVILAEGYGVGHAELIRRIFHAALARVGLS